MIAFICDYLGIETESIVSGISSSEMMAIMSFAAMDIAVSAQKVSSAVVDGAGIAIRPSFTKRNPEVDFIDGKGRSTLESHASRHGYSSPEKYLEDARCFLTKNYTSTTESFVTKEGTYFRYDRATNEFGIINKYGGISTYFKPDEGTKYWLDQVKRYAPK